MCRTSSSLDYVATVCALLLGKAEKVSSKSELRRLRQQEARARKTLADKQRLDKHQHVVQALRDPLLASTVIKPALAQVQLWRANQLCSLDYIETWEELLNDPVRAAEALESSSLWAIQLRQNSPFLAPIQPINSQAVFSESEGDGEVT